MVGRAVIRSDRLRWLVLVCGLALFGTLLQPVPWSPAATAEDVPQVTAGAGPVDRPAPRSARPDAALPPGQEPPPVPAGVGALGPPAQLSADQWARLPKPGQPAAQDAGDQVFTDVPLRPGFELGDTSLVAYFDVRDGGPAWSSWTVRLYDAGTQTEQASVVLPRSELPTSVCSAVRQFCRSFGSAEHWVLDPAKDYFITIAAVLDGGGEIVSAPSTAAKPRQTIVPPPIPAAQASGCGCGTALGTTDARQALRGDGINTATGAFTRVESDLSMASFGVPFTSARVYSSANAAVRGPFGPGWAWSYGMRVTVSPEARWCAPTTARKCCTGWWTARTCGRPGCVPTCGGPAPAGSW